MQASTASSSAQPPPYVPKIRGAVSDLDRTRFLKHAFEMVRQHFEAGLHALSAEPAIDTELTRRSDTDFVAEIFVSGNRKARCRIWLGGMMGGNEVGYYEGDQDMGNASNEVLTIADERDGLALTALMNMGIGTSRLRIRWIGPRRLIRVACLQNTQRNTFGAGSYGVWNSVDGHCAVTVYGCWQRGTPRFLRYGHSHQKSASGKVNWINDLILIHIS
jgi:hypothetical protein